jgi:hypothetical protein
VIRSLTRGVALAVLLGLSAATYAEDVIVLQEGDVLRGKIVREEETWIGIDTGRTVVSVSRDDIHTVVRDAGSRDAESSSDERAEGTAETPEQELSVEQERLLMGLSSEDRKERVKATEFIIASWPRWRPLVQHVLRNETNETARVEVVRVLDDRRVTDVRPLVEMALRDKSARVRTAALRVARHRKITEVEARALELMRTDAMWVVRQEAIRTLEDIGGELCLPHVLAAWANEQDKDRKRRYRRVMKALLGDDFGDDSNAWYAAADELFMGTREIRKGKVERAAESR